MVLIHELLFVAAYQFLVGAHDSDSTKESLGGPS